PPRALNSKVRATPRLPWPIRARKYRISRAFVRLGRAFPPALPTLARVRLQRLSPIGNRRNPPPRAENAANVFRSSARAAIPFTSNECANHLYARVVDLRAVFILSQLGLVRPPL